MTGLDKLPYLDYIIKQETFLEFIKMHPKGTPSPGSGRLPKDENTRQIQQTLNEAAVTATKKIRDSIRGTDEKGHKVKPISMTRLKEYELAINHAIGSPRQKIELRHSGVMTLRDLAEIAYQEKQEDKDKPQSVEVKNDDTTTGSGSKLDSLG